MIRRVSLFIAAATALAWNSVAPAQIRIAAYNTATAFETNGNPRPGLQTVLQGIGNESVNGVAKRIDLMFLTEQNNSTGTSTTQILSMMNNLYGAGTYAKSSLIANSTTPPTIDSPALVYDTSKFTLVNETAIGTVSGSGMPRQEIRYQLRPVGYGPNSDFYVYTVHYKASGGADNINRRNLSCRSRAIWRLSNTSSRSLRCMD